MAGRRVDLMRDVRANLMWVLFACLILGFLGVLKDPFRKRSEMGWLEIGESLSAERNFTFVFLQRAVFKRGHGLIKRQDAPLFSKGRNRIAFPLLACQENLCASLESLLEGADCESKIVYRLDGKLLQPFAGSSFVSQNCRSAFWGNRSWGSAFCASHWRA